MAYWTLSYSTAVVAAPALVTWKETSSTTRNSALTAWRFMSTKNVRKMLLRIPFEDCVDLLAMRAPAGGL